MPRNPPEQIHPTHRSLVAVDPDVEPFQQSRESFRRQLFSRIAELSSAHEKTPA
jgi:hypothetical protein